MNWRPASAELVTVDSTFPTSTKSSLILGPSSSRPPLMFYPPMVTSNIYWYPDEDNEYWCYWLWVMVRLQMLQERNVCRRKRREIRDMEQSHPKWDHSAGWSKNIWSMSSISSEFPSWIVILIFIVIFQIPDSSNDKQDNWGVCWGNGRWQSSLCFLSSAASPPPSPRWHRVEMTSITQVTAERLFEDHCPNQLIPSLQLPSLVIPILWLTKHNTTFKV